MRHGVVVLHVYAYLECVCVCSVVLITKTTQAQQMGHFAYCVCVCFFFFKNLIAFNADICFLVCDLYCTVLHVYRFIWILWNSSVCLCVDAFLDMSKVPHYSLTFFTCFEWWHTYSKAYISLNLSTNMITIYLFIKMYRKFIWFRRRNESQFSKESYYWIVWYRYIFWIYWTWYLFHLNLAAIVVRNESH